MEKKKRQLQAEQTKERIFKTAIELFEKRGFNQVSVDEIVRKSKSSKGAFYGHFKTKYSIFLEKFKEIDSYYEQYIEKMPKELDFKEKVLYLFEGQMDYLEHELGMDMMRTIYMNGLIESEENFFLNSNRNIYKIIRNFIILAINEKVLSEQIDVDHITMLITRCMRGTLYDWIASGSGFNLLEESRVFVTFFLDGLLYRYSPDKDEK